MVKNAPIKFFAKREIDEMRTEAGGGGKSPKWLLTGTELINKSKEVVGVLDEVEKIFSKRDELEEFIPAIVKTKLAYKAKAKTHRAHISNIFDTTKENSMIGVVGNDELLLRINKADITKIKKKVMDYQKNAYGLSCLEDIEVFSPIIRYSDEESITNYKIKLFSFQNYEVDKAVMKLFEKKCDAQDIIYNKTEYAGGLIVYKLLNVAVDSMSLIENYSGILSIEPMPKYEIDLDCFNSSSSLLIKTPNKDESYVTIGVLDSGIERIPQLAPWIERERQTFYPNDSIDPSHGTFVAGIILYGDMLEDNEYTGLKGCKLFDANIFPDLTKESIDEDELINNIREVIGNNYTEIKIWNLSGGLIKAIDENEFSDFAKALDSIQDEFGVVICKSAGNSKNFMRNNPKEKIPQSADSVRAIVVGSIANKKGKYDFAEVDEPSPFTRIGRGPANIVKPDVVHYGGNAGTDKDGNLVTTGVSSFNINGDVIKNVGTSFSTPRISAIMGGLQNEIAEEYDPLLLKGLLIHSATYSEKINLPMNEKVNQMGFGMPKNIKHILYNDENEITLILRDTLEKGQFIDIQDFPFPQSLIEDGYYYGEIIVTLVYDPILESSQGSEYCQSNLNVYFGSYDEKYDRDIEKSNILNPIGRLNGENLLKPSEYSKTSLKTAKGHFALSERMLIEYGKKFYPVKKYAVDLSEITNANREKYLKGQKQWFLKIEGLYRDFIERKAQLEGLDLSQDFCLLITIRDPRKKNRVYDEVTQLLNINNFLHNNIKLHQNIDININN